MFSTAERSISITLIALWFHRRARVPVCIYIFQVAAVPSPGGPAYLATSLMKSGDNHRYGHCPSGPGQAQFLFIFLAILSL